MKNYNVGIIGYGGFGKFLHHWWSKLEGVKVTAIADAKLQDDHSGEYKVYQNGLDLLNDPEVEIVSNCNAPRFARGHGLRGNEGG